MKYFSTLVLLLWALFGFSQEVTNLTSIVANGGITIDPAGNLYVAHFGPLPPNPSIGKNIYKITPEGSSTLFLDGALNVGSGNLYHSEGFLYQSNFATNTIYKIDSTGVLVDNNFAQISGPVGITEGPDNNLYISSCNTGSIQKVLLDGSASTFVAGAFFACANGITFAGDGNFYTTNFSDGRITKITPDGTASTLGTTSASGNGHITYREQDQSLYIASYGGHRIYRMDLNGNASLFAGTGTPGATNSMDPLTASFDKPNGIAVSPDGCSLYISQDMGVLREIKFQDQACLTNLIDPFDEVGLKLYPNPVNDFVRIDNPNELSFIKMTVSDSRGKLILASDFSNELVIDSLAEGIYFLSLYEKDGRIFSERFIVK